MIKTRYFACFILFFSMSCSTLVTDAYLPTLKDMETPVYVMKNDVKIEERIHVKRKKVHIIKTPGDNWIKVYGYPTEIDVLKAERLLLLFMFEDDFKDEKFDVKLFQDKLDEIVEKESAVSADAGKVTENKPGVAGKKSEEKKAVPVKPAQKNPAGLKPVDAKKPPR